MTDWETYITTVKLFFSFLNREFGFGQIKEIENGNAFYNVEYRDTQRVISISYENIEDYLQVIVLKLKNGQLPDYDDKTHTLHLNVLNKIILPVIDKGEIAENSLLFKNYKTKNSLERKLLNSAKELRLALKYWTIVNDTSIV